ncbi:MAG: hypothetical protein KIH10_16370 [Candidatus Freyarchaeota archaeon]|nr:hypothetical protein [Candidatus Jordarchaeia archaeon]MBS7281139.1 hypothetical protein [Candidatus Jordarchaeia archaeon]
MSRKQDKSLGLQMDYEVEVRDKNGKLLDKQAGKSHTWVRIYTRFLREIFANQDGQNRTFSATNTSGASVTAWAGSGGTSQTHLAFASRAPANNDAYGIQVGSSDTAYNRDQYSLQSKIAHGSGSGQLLYGEVTVEDVALEDSTERFRIIRAFTNSSGSAVTVKEIGIVILNRAGTTLGLFLFVRDVLASPISVPDGASLTVRYRIFVSYA